MKGRKFRKIWRARIAHELKGHGIQKCQEKNSVITLKKVNVKM